MQPVNYSFAPPHGYGMAKREQVQTAVAAINISAITVTGQHEIRLTMASDPLIAKWSPGMQIALRDSSDAFIAPLQITKIDHANPYYIYCYTRDAIAISKNSDIANGIQWGVVGSDIVIDGVNLKNNLGQLIGYQYNEDGYFYFKKADRNTPVVFQITNMDAVTDITDAIVYFSMDRINWHPLPTALASSTIAATESSILIMDYGITCYLRLFVDCDGADYYVLNG